MTYLGEYVEGRRLSGGRAYRQSKVFKDYIRDRDNYTCQVCGKPAYEVHHIIPYKECRETRLDNVQVMCRSCNLDQRQLRCNPYKSLGDWYHYLEQELYNCN